MDKIDKTNKKITREFAYIKKSSTFDLLPHCNGAPSKVRSRPAEHMQAPAFFLDTRGCAAPDDGVKSVNVKKNAQKLAYVQFLLYLCSRFEKDQAFGR